MKDALLRSFYTSVDHLLFSEGTETSFVLIFSYKEEKLPKGPHRFFKIIISGSYALWRQCLSFCIRFLIQLLTQWLELEKRKVFDTI